MAGTNQFYPIATDASANVLSNATWQASNTRQVGFQSGIMPSNGLNVALRQGTVLSSAIGSFIAGQGFDALDNGDLATLTANFKAALLGSISQTAAIPHNSAKFFTNGSFTWTCPAGVTLVWARVVGGGASGNCGTSVYSGGGGGAGGSTEGYFVTTPGRVYNIIAGKGGSSQTNSANYGGAYGLAGGSSSFDNLASAPGAPAGSVNFATGTPGGAAGTGGLNSLPGNVGGDGSLYSTYLGGAGGNGPYNGAGRTGTPNGISATGAGSGGGGSYGPQPTFSGAGADGGVEIRW